LLTEQRTAAYIDGLPLNYRPSATPLSHLTPSLLVIPSEYVDKPDIA